MTTKNNPDLNTTPIDDELNKKEQEQTEQIEQKEIDTFELKFNTRRNERISAFNFLYAVDRSDYQTDLSEVIKNFEIGFNIQIPEKSFALQLAHSAIENRDALDQQINPHLKNWKLERLGCCTKLILYMSLWELNQPDAVPSIVINEAVELAKMFAEKDAYKFINGILDEICKTKGDKHE
ncbi:MAG: transcription antitermination factor NusB [bacterium]